MTGDAQTGNQPALRCGSSPDSPGIRFEPSVSKRALSAECEQCQRDRERTRAPQNTRFPAEPEVRIHLPPATSQLRTDFVWPLYLPASSIAFSVPDEVNPLTKDAVQIIAGTGLIGVAKDTLPRNGVVPGLTVTFAEIELDVETGNRAGP